MTVKCSHVLAAAIVVLLPVGAALAADSVSQTGTSDQSAAAPVTTTPVYGYGCCDYEDPLREYALRVGAWGVHATGSPAKVGEYQSLDSSPFWDVDVIRSDGVRTLDLIATGSDDEDTDVHLHFYGGPRLTANIDYERFPHELETTKYYPGFANGPGNATSSDFFSYNSLAPAGQDYAIQVQEFKANFKGDLTADGSIRWRVNVFGIDKEGDRQANALTHCYNASITYPGYPMTSNPTVTRQCHVLSQPQHIDWQTTQVEPGIEAHLGALTVEYTHLARQFNQDDQDVTNLYRTNTPLSSSTGLGFPAAAGSTFSTAGNNIVPDETTQMDRVKASWDMGNDTYLYSFGYYGNTTDELIETSRQYSGADVRLTNNSVDGLTVTGYGKLRSEHAETQTTPLNTLYPTQAGFYQEANLTDIGPEIGRDTWAVGVNGRWQPFCNDGCDSLRSRMAITAGDEYGQIRRTNDYYDLLSLTPTSVFYQPDTNSNTLSVGIEEKWSLNFTSYLRYKYITTQYPLFGVNAGDEVSVDDALNTLLPTVENRVELGSTWTVADKLLLNAVIYAEQQSNHGPYAYFNSNQYPYFLTAMYALSSKWSVTGGYGNLRNTIAQDVTLGMTASPFTAPWQYMARSDVFNLGSTYVYSKRLRFVGNIEYVRGLNVVTSTPTPPGAISYDGLGDYSEVSTTQCQASVGVDYLWRPNISTYFRYNYDNFGDLVSGLTSGTANMFLLGLTATM